MSDQMLDLPEPLHLRADYAAYLRGCSVLRRDPIPERVFREWMLDIMSFNPFHLEFPPRYADFAADKVARVLHQWNHINSAMSASGPWFDEDGDEDTGVRAPLLTGPFSRSGAEQKPIPRDEVEENAA